MRLTTIAGGVVELATGVVVGGYGVWAHRAGAGDDAAQSFVHGAAAFLVFLFGTAWGWLSIYLFVEGLLRVGSGVSGEPLGILPVAIGRAIVRRARERRVPEDLVMTGGDGLVIESARDYDWGALTTVEVDGTMYAVTREAGTGAERPYRYRLRSVDAAHVVRSVLRYR
ncbi:MAG: hypothetical protein JWN44_7169 [Myxococcales bacterium]|nr:hypothetical protein [Myxococcales bacterium]